MLTALSLGLALVMYPLSARRLIQAALTVEERRPKAPIASQAVAIATVLATIPLILSDGAREAAKDVAFLWLPILVVSELLYRVGDETRSYVRVHKEYPRRSQAIGLAAASIAVLFAFVLSDRV